MVVMYFISNKVIFKGISYVIMNMYIWNMLGFKFFCICNVILGFVIWESIIVGLYL